MNNFFSTVLSIISDSSYFGILLTIGVFGVVQLFAKKYKKSWLNPLVLSLVIIIAFMLLTDIPYEKYQPSGDMIVWLLTPATVCLAIPLYEQLQVLKTNKLAILVSVFAGCLSSIATVFIMAKLMKLPDIIHTSLSPKGVTAAFATNITAELGGIVACTVAGVIITGLLGSFFVIPLKKIFRIKSDIAWGLASGNAGHAAGTATIIQESKVGGAMSSLAILLAGLFTVVLVPIFVSFY